MLTFTCDTCKTEYKTFIAFSGGVQYQLDGQRIVLGSEHDDCSNCSKDIEAELEKHKDEIRKKIKEKKQYGTQANK